MLDLQGHGPQRVRRWRMGGHAMTAELSTHPPHQRRRRLLVALLVGLGLALWPRRVQSAISRAGLRPPQQPRGEWHFNWYT